MRNDRRLVAAACALLLGGCSAFNPYQRSERLDDDLRTPPAEARALAGDLDGALAAVTDQRNEWFGALSSHARVLNGASLATLSIAAWGLYEGLKPGFVSGGAATDASRRHVAKAAIGSGGAYAIGNLFLNTKHDESYVEGYKSLTCLVVRVRPFAMTAKQRAELLEALGALEAQIAKQDKVFLVARHEHGLDTRADRAQPNATTRLVAAGDTAVRIARKTHERAVRLVRGIDESGPSLRRQAELVTAVVSEQIRGANPSLRTPEELIAGLRGVVGKLQAVEPVDREAEGGGSEAPSDGAQDQGSADSGAAADGGTAAKAPASKGDISAQTRALVSELADLKQAMLDPKAAKAKEQAKKKPQPAKPSDKPALAANKQLEETQRERLADGIADLYSARRKVNAYLVSHSESAHRIKDVKECKGGPASTMAIVPGEDKAVARGGSYRFNISGSKGLPIVSLDGAGGSVTTNLEGGVAVATVAVAADAPEGKLRLLVHDSATRAVEDVVLSIPAKPAPKTSGGSEGK